MTQFLKFIYSTKLMAVLFLVFAATMGIATFIENDYGTETAKALVYNAWWFELIMVLFAFNFFGNIFRFKLYKKEKLIVLVFHLAFFLILVGAGITRYISFEGKMPIKEGEISNTFLSEANYLNISINDGKKQKTPDYSKKVLFSSLGKNDFTYSTNFEDIPVTFELINYTPNVVDSFEESNLGEEYILFVESEGGNRHNHYIKKGTAELIHGVLVGFNAPQRCTIDFRMIGEKLKIETSSNGTFLRMKDQFKGKIAKDSLQDFSLLSLHNVAGLQFVVPKPPIKGKYQAKQGSKEESSQAQLTFKVTSQEESKEISVRGAQYRIEPPTQFSLGKLNFRVNYGAKQLKLPFNIKLNDFQLEKYPGSESPMSYASEVTVISPEKTFDYRIYMNHILNYKGYRFFQSSYNITEEYEESHFSINHDFWGTNITYAGYFLLYAGLILILFVKGTRFHKLRKNLKRIQKNKTILFIALLFSAFSYAQPAHKQHALTQKQIDSLLEISVVSKEHAQKFSKLVIQDSGGRMKPVHTFASELLRKLSKHESFKNLNASQVFLSIQQNPRLWFEVPVIYIEKFDDKLRDIIHIPHDQKYAKLIDFFDDKQNYVLGSYLEKAHKSNIKSKFEKDVINVNNRVNLLYSAITGSILKIFPIPNDENNKWVSQNELLPKYYKGKDSIFVNKILPIYLSTLTISKKENNYQKSEQILNGLITFQKKYGTNIYPSDKKIKLEIWYNKYDVFKNLFSYYMYISVLMFVLLIFQIFKSNKTIKWLINTCTAVIILLFLAHTAGLIARWIISNHAPWSNAYESMIYVGWATMLFGLIFGKKSNMTLAATAFLTAFILMVAHWNWMDPEIANLQPVLNSYWLMIHVAVIVASYGPFALGMILGLISLILIILTTKKNKQKINNIIKELTIINEMALTVGLVMLTIGNFLGGQWANESWGRYWGWDPKETWALISIMLYAFVLHVRLVPKLRGIFVYNFLSVIAFASILMTYFGVNFYLSGLHSYASGDQAITPTFVYYSILVVTIIAITSYIKYKKHYKK